VLTSGEIVFQDVLVGDFAEQANHRRTVQHESKRTEFLVMHLDADEVSQREQHSCC